MKKISVFTLGLLFAFSNLVAEVVVIFENPEDYRDIDYDYRGNKRGQRIYLPDLKKYIEKHGEKYLREAQVLTLTFTDIDLAGDYEPWRTPPADDIRIVKGIYPPRMSFSYELTDGDGNVLKSGEESLVDLSFDFRIRTSHFDHLFYEKAMIGDWMRSFNQDDS